MKKSKKGGKGKKGGGGGKKKGKKPPKAGEKTVFVLPADERGVIPGFGCMVTKAWRDAYYKDHFPLMVEIARTNMQRYWETVTDAQSKASLLLILGYSLIKAGEGEAMKEGMKCNMEALELIRSMGERRIDDIVKGVWPEDCLFGWHKFLEQLDPSERKEEMEWMLEMVNLTRRTINSEMERELIVENADEVELLIYFSRKHYQTELTAIYYFSVNFDLLSEEDTERWLGIFGKRVEEMKTIYERGLGFAGC
jgi:hypothetical protein